MSESKNENLTYSSSVRALQAANDRAQFHLIQSNYICIRGEQSPCVFVSPLPSMQSKRANNSLFIIVVYFSDCKDGGGGGGAQPAEDLLFLIQQLGVE